MPSPKGATEKTSHLPNVNFQLLRVLIAVLVVGTGTINTSAGPWGGLVDEDFLELSRVIHVLAAATVEELPVMDELSDA